MLIKKWPYTFLMRSDETHCPKCKVSLQVKTKEVEIKSRKTKRIQQIKGEILFCPQCRQYFLTSHMHQKIVERYPWHSVMGVFDSVQERNKSMRNVSSPKNQKKEKMPRGKKVSNSPVLLSNADSISKEICPICHNSLSKEAANIPVRKENGDFLRYYAETALYCHSCNKRYINMESVISILKKIQNTSNRYYRVHLANANVQYDVRSSQYLDYPTLDVDNAIYSPSHNNSSLSEKEAGTMNLNPQSFLRKMGYAVTKSVEERHYILTEAVGAYGKRRVTDHLKFLIDTRRGQTNGDTKYANAISIWQSDINYVFNLK